MNYLSVKAIFLFQILLCLSSSNPLVGQRLTIPDLVVGENDSFVDVPVYIDWPDSSVAMQLSILWEEQYLKFDTIKFAANLLEDNISTLYNVVREGQIRVLVTPTIGGINIIQEEKDSLGFIITFKIIEDLPGGIIIGFNPNFANAFTSFSLDEIDAIVTDGSVTYPGRTVGNQNSRITAEEVRIFPNPASNRLRVTGLPFGEASPSFQLFDQFGRIIYSGVLTGGEMRLPANVPNGQYWLNILVHGQSFVKPIMVKR
jgi:hypothetical protein